ncbi:CDGSH iron-sulfur domain-containing protein [Nocardia albiluteola]|nr:CDGSH iron-sulfur domain-containing protein [Nocardia albiluteola]
MTTEDQDISGAAQLCELVRRAEALAAQLENAGGAADSAVAARLRDRVLRPLRAMAGAAVGEAVAHQATTGGDVAASADLPEHEDSDSDGALWRLACDATSLLAASPDLMALGEPVAALHELVLDCDGDEAVQTEQATALHALMSGLPTRIACLRNGPYLVTNVRHLHDWQGLPLPVRPQLALCRCGASASKPYCDGSHARSGFSGDKHPDRVPDRLDTYVGHQLTVLDNRGTCQHSGLCTDRLATVFRAQQEPFVAPSGDRMDEIIRAVRDCPSGALGYAMDGIAARGAVDWHGTREPAIEVSKDGPYRVVGGVELVDATGRDTTRNAGASREHFALCRCGASKNKPFCSGMHWYAEFRDPVPDPDCEPTIFEWAGGVPALTRMTRLFYEKFVPADPLLAPLFAAMSADHAERVAKWLAEVFCGPRAYSRQYGGYERMLSQHIAKCLTEEQRSRWVSLLLQAAREAGLPNDPEFRSAFQSYLEWGSRLAVENSQSHAQPPQHMPIPHWDWNTAAGPPGCRPSALVTSADADPPPVLPASGTQPSFERHIKTLFRQRDRRAMQFALDLWSLADVRSHAPEILRRVRAGTMPCDKAWPREWVEAFEHWIDTGMNA